MSKEELEKRVGELNDALDLMLRNIEILREGLLPGSVLQDIGDEYGLTRERVRQIIKGFVDDRVEAVNRLKAGSEKFRCVMCGKPKTRSKLKSKYCSRSCQRLAVYYNFDEERECKTCGAKFYPLRVNKYSRGTGEYCSVKCYLDDPNSGVSQFYGKRFKNKLRRLRGEIEKGALPKDFYDEDFQDYLKEVRSATRDK